MQLQWAELRKTFGMRNKEKENTKGWGPAYTSVISIDFHRSVPPSVDSLLTICHTVPEFLAFRTVSVGHRGLQKGEGILESSASLLFLGLNPTFQTHTAHIMQVGFWTIVIWNAPK